MLSSAMREHFCKGAAGNERNSFRPQGPVAQSVSYLSHFISTVIGLALSCVSFVLLFVTNWVSRRISDNSLW